MTKFRWAAVLRSFFCFHLRMKQLLDSKHRVCIWESCLLKRIFISFNKRLKLVKWQVHNVVNTQLLFAERAIQTPRPVLAAVPGGHAAESAGIETENTAVRGNRQRHLVLSKTEMKRPPAIQYRSTHKQSMMVAELVSMKTSYLPVLSVCDVMRKTPSVAGKSLFFKYSVSCASGCKLCS